MEIFLAKQEEKIFDFFSGLHFFKIGKLSFHLSQENFLNKI